MTESFKLKVDLNKVSKSVKQFVADIARTEGNKKKIDSENEYNKLSSYLSGASVSMNKDEIGYIQGFMIEYQNKKAEEFEKNCVTDNTRKEVSKIAKRMGDKKKIDTDEEAQALATMLRNTHNELNLSDIYYIQNILINSGYANYLPKPEEPVQVVNVTINEIYVEDCEKNEAFGEENKNNIQPETEPVPKNFTPKKPRSVKPRKPDKPNVPKTEPTKPEEPKPEEKAKPVIEEKDRTKGFALADRIVHELNSHIADNSVIKDALARVNNRNAYSFVGKFVDAARQGVNEGVFSVSDLFNRLSYQDTLHVMECLAAQAQKIGLGSNYAFQELSAEINFANRLLEENPDADPTEATIAKADKAIRDLYNEMSKVYK